MKCRFNRDTDDLRQFGVDSSFFVEIQNLYDRENAMLANDVQLIEQGIVNSMGLTMLMVFLDDEFDVLCEPDEIILENFASINAIADFVLKKLGTPA